MRAPPIKQPHISVRIRAHKRKPGRGIRACCWVVDVVSTGDWKTPAIPEIEPILFGLLVFSVFVCSSRSERPTPTVLWNREWSLNKLNGPTTPSRYFTAEIFRVPAQGARGEVAMTSENCSKRDAKVAFSRAPKGTRFSVRYWWSSNWSAWIKIFIFRNLQDNFALYGVQNNNPSC